MGTHQCLRTPFANSLIPLIRTRSSLLQFAPNDLHKHGYEQDEQCQLEKEERKLIEWEVCQLFK